MVNCIKKIIKENCLFFKFRTHQFWTQEFCFVTCYVTNKMRLKTESRSLWTLFYCNYFITYEPKLPNISLFSETGDNIYSSLGNFQTSNTDYINTYCPDQPPPHLFSQPPPDLTDVTVSRTTPGRDRQPPQKGLCALIRKWLRTAESGGRHNVWFDKSCLDFAALLLFPLPRLQSESILES